MLAQDKPLVRLLRPHAAKVLREVPQLTLHSVAQLLLTATQASRPQAFEHAVAAMLLCGSLMDAHGGSPAELRAAMLCGLLHDLGEMYIDPKFGEADAERSLDFASYQQLVVHPHVGQLLIAQLTNYPKSVAQAIGEHHERLDGSGYPRGSTREDVSTLGRMLAVAEATLAVLHDPQSQLARLSVALRVVPGEFDLGWVGEIARLAQAETVVAAKRDKAALAQRLGQLDSALKGAHDNIELLTASAESDGLLGALKLSDALLNRLRAGLVCQRAVGGGRRRGRGLGRGGGHRRRADPSPVCHRARGLAEGRHAVRGRHAAAAVAGAEPASGGTLTA